MSKRKKYWVYSPQKPQPPKPTDFEKESIQNFFQPLIEAFKKQYIKENPNKEFSYTVDIYSKWYRSYFYLCEKSKSERPNRRQDEFESKFVRLTFLGDNKFDFSYFRHTGQWFLVAESLTMEECQELILSNPNFQPLG